MPENLILSIITVNLNNLEGLKKTMVSVFEQTWQEFEFIIIDGGSIDGSKEYIESHSNKINFWISEPDKGIYNGMNKGIKAAKGEFLLFLNSGDWLYNKSVLSNIYSSFSIEYDFIYGDIIKISRNGTSFLDKGKDEVTLKTFIEGSLNHQALFVNKKKFDQFGLYDEKFEIVSDWKFTLITLGMNDSKLNYINQVISFYDLEGVSLNFEKRDIERNKVIRELLPLSIFKDYEVELNSKPEIESNRFKMFKEMENHKLARKFNSAIFRFLLAVFTGKTLKDL